MQKSNRVPLFAGAIVVLLGLGLMGARRIETGKDAAGMQGMVRETGAGAEGIVRVPGETGAVAGGGPGAGKDAAGTMGRPDAGMVQGEGKDAAGMQGKGAGEGLMEAGETGKGEIAWMKLDEAAGKLQKEQRPVLIDLYTTWCGWCKQMDKKTYSNKNVAAYLQEKFYPVKLDAETHDVMSWNGKDYRFNPGYKSNEIAVYLTRGRLEFPTTIIIPPGGEPQAIPGYMEPKELELLVKYFGEGMYNKMSFDQYQKSFKASW